MKYINEKEYVAQMKRIKAINRSKERQKALKDERNKFYPKFKLPSTSKLILLGVILICLQIVIFCEYVIIKTEDTSAMYALIGIPATLIPIIWAYYSKSKAENTVGGIIFETAMREQEIDTENSEEDSVVD